MTYALKDADPVHAVDDVSLEIGAGEAVGILGESGSGKTTLANAIMRMLPANSTCSGGGILIDDRDLLKLPETELRSLRGRAIAMIPQDPALCLNPVITVGCQILEVLRAHVPLPNKARKARVLELLMEVGFEHPDKIASAYPHQLSGGQRQRVTIAQAMSCRPSLVIADEPTSKLDATLEGETINLLSEIRRQHRTAFLVITHDPGVLAGWVDRIAVMYAGRIVEIGGTKQVLGKPSTRTRKRSCNWPVHPNTTKADCPRSKETRQIQPMFPLAAGSNHVVRNAWSDAKLHTLQSPRPSLADK